MTRIGPQMKTATSIALLNPGCCKLDIARVLGNRRVGYQIVNRAIRAGLVRSVELDGRHTLFGTIDGMNIASR